MSNSFLEELKARLKAVIDEYKATFPQKNTIQNGGVQSVQNNLKIQDAAFLTKGSNPILAAINAAKLPDLVKACLIKKFTTDNNASELKIAEMQNFLRMLETFYQNNPDTETLLCEGIEEKGALFIPIKPEQKSATTWEFKFNKEWRCNDFKKLKFAEIKAKFAKMEYLIKDIRMDLSIVLYYKQNLSKQQLTESIKADYAKQTVNLQRQFNSKSGELATRLSSSMTLASVSADIFEICEGVEIFFGADVLKLSSFAEQTSISENRSVRQQVKLLPIKLGVKINPVIFFPSNARHLVNNLSKIEGVFKLDVEVHLWPLLPEKYRTDVNGKPIEAEDVLENKVNTTKKEREAVKEINELDSNIQKDMDFIDEKYKNRKGFLEPAGVVDASENIKNNTTRLGEIAEEWRNKSKVVTEAIEKVEKKITTALAGKAIFRAIGRFVPVVNIVVAIMDIKDIIDVVVSIWEWFRKEDSKLPPPVRDIEEILNDKIRPIEWTRDSTHPDNVK